MTNLRVGPALSVEPGTSPWREFDADLLIFDKDGTLIDFESMWGRLAIAWVDRLRSALDQEGLEVELYEALGYDWRSQRTMPQSPLAIATTGQLHTIMAATLFRCGIPWPEAETRVREVAEQVDRQITQRDMVRPVGDLPGILRRIQSAGVLVAVVTTDHRAESVEQLEILGITHLVDSLVCGDDGMPTKPAPDTLLYTCRKLGCEPSRTMVVGDTTADLRMARNAGAGLAVAVLTGAGTQVSLSDLADVVVHSIESIHVERT